MDTQIPQVPLDQQQDVSFDLSGTPSSQTLVAVRIDGDPGRRYQITADGTMKWGPGDGTTDISFQRTATGVLTFTGTLNLSGMTPGSILFAATNGKVSQNNASLFWDSVNLRLGIGNNSPMVPLEVRNGTTPQEVQIANTWTSATNYETFRMVWGTLFSNPAMYLLTDNGSGGGSPRAMAIGPLGAASLYLYSNGNARWQTDQNGHFYTATTSQSNLLDIGSAISGPTATAGMPRTIYAGTSIRLYGTDISNANSQYLNFDGASAIAGMYQISPITGTSTATPNGLLLGGGSAVSDVNLANIVKNTFGAMSAYPQGVNTTGDDIHLTGGMGARFLTIVNFANLAGATATFQPDGHTPKVLTEGTDWNRGASNGAAATSLASAITTNSATTGCTATAVGAVVYCTKVNSVHLIKVTSSDGTNLPVTVGIDGGCIVFGTAQTNNQNIFQVQRDGITQVAWDNSMHQVMANAFILQWKDSGATARSILQLFSDNNVYLDNPASGNIVMRPGLHTALTLNNSGTIAFGNFNIGFFGGSPVAKGTRGGTFTNNITSGGTTDSPANWTDLTTYANDAAAIRNFCYQVARVLAQYDAAFRSGGFNLLT